MSPRRIALGLACALLALPLAPHSSPGASATLLEIRVVPGRASIFPGGAFAFEAKGEYSDGSVRDVTRKAQFESTNTTVADFVRKNVLVAEAAGDTTIKARLKEVVSAEVPFTVSPIVALQIDPATLDGIRLGSRFGWVVSATLANGADGFDVSDSRLGWSSSNDDFVSIGNKGRSKGLSRGLEVTDAPVTLTAALSSPMLSATRNVHVVDPDELDSVSVQPATRLIQLGDPFRFRAIGDFDGVLAEITLNVDWISMNSSVATTTRSGVIRVRDFGTTTIQVRDRETDIASTLPNSAQLIVVGRVVSLTMDPPALALAVGAEDTFDAIADVEHSDTNFDWSGRVDWTSSDPETVSVNDGGRVRCEDIGVATITARDPRSGNEADAEVTCS